jgi:hypothetical protein
VTRLDLGVVPSLPPYPDRNAGPRYEGPGAIDVHLRPIDPDSWTSQGTLFEKTKDGWRSVCDVPCDGRVDGRDRFAISGSSVRASASFRPPADGTVVTVSPRSYNAGDVLLLADLGPGLLGTAFTIQGLADPEHLAPFAYIGVVALAVAVPLFIYGIYLESDRTSVSNNVRDP